MKIRPAPKPEKPRTVAATSAASAAIQNSGSERSRSSARSRPTLAPRMRATVPTARRGQSCSFLGDFSFANSEIRVDLLALTTARALPGEERARRSLRLLLPGAKRRRLLRGEEARALRLGRRRRGLGGLAHLHVELKLRAEPERHRIGRLQRRGVPMRAVADRLDGRLGGADEAHDLRVLQLRMVAHQPEDGVRPVLALRHRRVARAAALHFRHPHLRLGDLHAVVRIGLAPSRSPRA